MGTIAAVVTFGAVTRRLTPFLIATHPVLLEFANGSLAAVGAAAAFARVGEIPLWLVIVAGAVGMAKFDWMTWWAGRRWGRGMLAFFMTHPERVYTREQLLDRVWGGNVYVEERTIDVHIRRLRKALEEHGMDRLVQTVRGSGYRFSARDD